MSHKKKRKKALAELPPEEAAFVAALVARPEDDTARLVFADWLDERSDPRGAWLRDSALWAHLDADAVAWLLVPGTDARLPPAVEAASGAAVPFVRAWVRHGDTLNRWHRAGPFVASHRPPELRPVSELVARLQSENWYDCWEAVIDLGFHGPAAAPAAEALANVSGRVWPEFEGWDKDPLQRAAHTTLGAIGPGAAVAVPKLAGAAGDSGEACAALLAIRPDPDLVYQYLCCDEDSFARPGVRLVADLSGNPVGALVRILCEGDGHRSAAAAELLGEMGEAGADAVPAM
ncbi:MAG TPA: TIGR02996 domain-containing protein, partial [Gemmata sp.]